jgi:hypothetical protein
MLSLKKLDWKDQDSIKSEARYLCTQKHLMFVSSVSLLRSPDASMPFNHPEGCLYVDPRNKIGCIPIDQLDSIYEIVENADEELNLLHKKNQLYKKLLIGVLESSLGIDNNGVNEIIKNAEQNMLESANEPK